MRIGTKGQRHIGTKEERDKDAKAHRDKGYNVFSALCLCPYVPLSLCISVWSELWMNELSKS